MGYLVTQIWVYLLAALLIGGIIGWILKSFLCERECDARVSEWESKYNDLDARYKALSASGSAKGNASASASAGASADVSALKAQITGLEDTNRLQANRIADLEGELNSNVQGAMAGEDLSAKVELLEQDLAAARGENGKLSAQVKSANEKAAAAAAAGAAAGAAASASADNDAEVSKLKADLKVAGDENKRLAAEVKAAGSAAGKDVDAANAKVAKLESDLESCKAARAELEAQMAAATASPAPAPAAAAKGKKEKFTTDAPAPKNLLKAAQGTKDDLKEIWGVGPVMEGVLNKLGIYHFWQVSELSDRDVEWVSANINTFPDRIKRDRWVEQAGELHKKHHG